jgi:hypothetical protein
MLKALHKTKKGKERDDAEIAIVAVCSRIVEPDKRAEPVLIALEKASTSEKLVLLPLAGRLGGQQALALLRGTLSAGDPEVVDAGVRGLCNWPNLSAAEDLLKLVQAAKDQGHRQLAFRALVRVNSIPNEGSNPAKLAMLKKAMELAANNDERKTVLGGLATVKDIETLHYVLPYLDNKDLAQAACKTIVELAHSKTLREPNQGEFDRALDRVIAICKDKGLVDRAKQYKKGF